MGHPCYEKTKEQDSVLTGQGQKAKPFHTQCTGRQAHFGHPLHDELILQHLIMKVVH